MSYVPEPSELHHEWHLFDAQGQILGHMATRIAMILQGKHKPTYTPFMDNGDHVIVINADKVTMTGKKMTDKVYRDYSGYIGGLRKRTPDKILAVHPTELVELAVRRMLPKSRLGKRMFKKLKCYASTADFAGAKHPHVAQKPIPMPMPAAV